MYVCMHGGEIESGETVEEAFDSLSEQTSHVCLKDCVFFECKELKVELKVTD